jgi:double-strand break repair protein MRE11
VLGLATTHGADTVLLGGDLFHENKPSREAVVRVMRALSSACLVGEGEEEAEDGGGGVRFHVISPDPGAGLAAGAPNFTAPGHRVRLPVFSIHGNHDDPVGPGLLSAVDVLSSAGLVNYFGKRALEGSTAGTVVMSPILLQKVRFVFWISFLFLHGKGGKTRHIPRLFSSFLSHSLMPLPSPTPPPSPHLQGVTKIALYGLGNVRDERMARVLATPGAVAWERPANYDEFFSIFVLHQNRVPHGRSGARNTVQPRHLPEWLDFVVWGHEHESQPSPTVRVWEEGWFFSLFFLIHPCIHLTQTLSV